MEVLYGVHPVAEALKAGRRRFDHVIVAAERHDERLARLVADCKQAGVRVRQEPREHLTHLAGTPAHQGVVALVRPQEALAIEDLFSAPDHLASRAFFSRSMASKIRRISAHCCASPMAPG